MSNFNKEDLFDKELYELFKKSEDEDYKIYLSADSSLKLSKREKRKIEKVAKGISPYSTLRKIAIIFAIIGVSFASLMSVKAIREKIIEVLIEWHEKYIKVDFSKDKTPVDAESVQFEYKEPKISEEYSKYIFVQNETDFGIEYTTDSSIIIYRQNLIDSRNTFMTNQDTYVSYISINGYTGYTFSSKPNNIEYHTVVWQDENYEYSITSELHIEEIIVIAETIE